MSLNLQFTYSFIVLIITLCFNLGHSQTSINPATGFVDNLNQTINSVTPTQPSARPAGKYAEHQSICRHNVYDTAPYFSAELKQKRIDLIKLKISGDAKKETHKINNRLIKEYIDQQNMVQAKEQITLLKKEKLSSLDSDILNALVDLVNNNLAGARTTLNKSLHTNENNEEILTLLAEIYSKAGNYYEAGTIYEDLNLTKNNIYLAQRCEAMVLNSYNSDAEKICLLAIKKYPNNPFAQIYLGISYREREELKKAAAAFKNSIAIKPTEMGHVCLAESYYIKENFIEAAKQFNLAFDVNNNSIRALLGLAWTDLKNKNYSSSLAAFKKACKLNSKYEMELRKAFKYLSENKINESKKFLDAATVCGQ